MSVPLLAVQPQERTLHDDVHNVVDLAWLALVLRLQEVVARTGGGIPAADADKLARHLDLLALYRRSADNIGGETPWTSEAVIGELEEALADLQRRLAADSASVLDDCFAAVRLTKDEGASPVDILALADRCFGMLISLEFSVPQPLETLRGSDAMVSALPIV